jgi:ABC-type sugar transport system ATPase subunit
MRDDRTRGQESSSPPLDAQKHGIVTIYQEFNLTPTLTIADNMLLSREPCLCTFMS